MISNLMSYKQRSHRPIQPCNTDATTPPGGTYFFTVVTFWRWPWFNDVRYVAHLRQAFADEKARRPFEINAIVVMPDHLHTLWTLPEGDSDYSTRWRNIKRGFTAKVPAEDPPRRVG